MNKQRFRLSTIITFFVCIVVLFSLLLTDLLISRSTSTNIKENLEEKAKIVSRTVAKSQIVQEGLTDDKRTGAIQNYTSDIKLASDVMFVVVIDMEGVRHSHPNPNMIGKRFVGGDEKAVLNGEEYISTSKGTLGKSLRAFTPIYGVGNRQIGAVAVGISLESIQQALMRSHRNIIIVSILGVLVGVMGAFLLARYIKKILFGLEPLSIARIHEERNRMLQSVHEGIIAVDKDATITLVNKSALNLFKHAGLGDNPVGMRVSEYLPNSNLERVLKTGQAELDEEQMINGVSILVNRVPLVVQNQVVGVISTFRDKTEINQLAEQLTGVRMYAETLRAQSHEFMNKLHVILGMVKMGYHEELANFIKKTIDHHADEVGSVTKNIKDPALAGFMIGKMSYAREEQVELIIDSDTGVPELHNTNVTHELITILGNLIDNAIESLSGCDTKEITVLLNHINNNLYIIVSDTGPGVPPAMMESVFVKGESTKGDNRGFGLYLVQQSITSLGGSIDFRNNPDMGMEFQVVIPMVGGEE